MSAKYVFVRTDFDASELPLTVERETLAGWEDVSLYGRNCFTEAEIIEAARDADVIMTNESFITRGVLSALPKLRAVVRYGIGFDRVDLEAATELGIAVVNVPDFCHTELAQHVLLGVLAWNKRLLPLNAGVHAGKWLEARASISDAMGPTDGQVLGVLGFGNAGRRVAQLAIALGMQVVACSEHLTDGDRAMGVKYLPRDKMFATCDFLTINCVLNDRTRHSVGAHEFRLMKPSAVVINTARGAVIDESALIEALRSGEIAGAFLDVLEHEPPAADNPLLRMDNVYITPHTSYYSSKSSRILSQSVVQEALRCVTSDERPINIVNRAVCERENYRLAKA